MGVGAGAYFLDTCLIGWTALRCMDQLGGGGKEKKRMALYCRRDEYDR